MTTDILIMTKSHDAGGHLVGAALESMGFAPQFHYGATYPMQDQHSLLIEKVTSFRSAVMPNLLPQGGFRSVWLRRPEGPYLGDADLEEQDRRYASALLDSYSNTLTALQIAAYGSTAFWVNSFYGRMAASSKALQLSLARKHGLTTPPTLISNAPEDVKSFFKKCGPLACKPLVMGGWGEWNVNRATSLTARIDDIGLIPDASIRIQPAIYQPYIAKAFEVRTAIFGGRQFSIALNTQAEVASTVDARGARWTAKNTRPFELPAELVARCRALMADLGIVYGTFDFIVTPDEELVFLEVNEAGQTFFMEQIYPDMQVIDAFAHFLAQRSLAGWKPSDKRRLQALERSDTYLRLREEARQWVASPEL